MQHRSEEEDTADERRREDTPIHDVTPTPTPDAAQRPRQIRRRTIVKGAAWSVPVIAATVAVPAHAASVGTVRVVTAPSSTLACHPTTSAFTFRVTDELPTTVKLVFADGWGGRWAPGAPASYPTDTDGIVTIPAGDIIAGHITSALYAETAGGARGGGGVAIKVNGEIWRSEPDNLEWTKIGDGADTGPDTAGYGNFSGDPDAVWIKGGVLMWGTGLTNMPAASNSDFVRVYTSETSAIGIRSNGEIWRSDGAGMPWLKVGDGASTDLSAAAAGSFGTPDPFWIKDGVLQRGGAPVAMPAGGNSGFLRVYATDHGAVAVKANREIWRAQDTNPTWEKFGDGAFREASAAGFENFGGSDAIWIRTTTACD